MIFKVCCDTRAFYATSATDLNLGPNLQDLIHLQIASQYFAEDNRFEMSERNEDMDIVQDPAASDNLCNQSRPDAVKLSVVSKNYDMGSKGYLDDEEQVLRNLDKGNQGHLSVESLKVLVRDLDKSNQEKRMLKTVVKVFSVGLVVFLLANFGLVWST